MVGLNAYRESTGTSHRESTGTSHRESTGTSQQGVSNVYQVDIEKCGDCETRLDV